MNIPIEIVAALFVAILALQGWALVEIISLKVKMARYEELDKRTAQLEKRISHIESRRT